MSALGEGASITCVNCDGKGYLIERRWGGPSYPRECPGCYGTGKQTIQPSMPGRVRAAVPATPTEPDA